MEEHPSEKSAEQVALELLKKRGANTLKKHFPDTQTDRISKQSFDQEAQTLKSALDKTSDELTRANLIDERMQQASEAAKIGNTLITIKSIYALTENLGEEFNIVWGLNTLANAKVIYLKTIMDRQVIPEIQRLDQRGSYVSKKNLVDQGPIGSLNRELEESIELSRIASQIDEAQKRLDRAQRGL